MIKKILIVLLLLLPLAAGAEGAAEKRPPTAEYLFHLYYDNGQLYADRDFQFNYSIISEEFIQESLTTQFPYRGEIMNMVGEVANHFVFDPKQGDVNFTKGKISVKAPYVADGQRAVFYDNQNQPILTIPVSESSFCDDNGICNADRGEDYLSCPKDCKQTLPAPPTPTSTATTGGSNGILSAILYTLAGLVLAGLAWWFFKRRNNSGGMTLPPSPLPTPTPPPNPGNPV